MLLSEKNGLRDLCPKVPTVRAIMPIRSSVDRRHPFTRRQIHRRHHMSHRPVAFCTDSPAHAYHFSRQLRKQASRIDQEMRLANTSLLLAAAVIAGASSRRVLCRLGVSVLLVDENATHTSLWRTMLHHLDSCCERSVSSSQIVMKSRSAGLRLRLRSVLGGVLLWALRPECFPCEGDKPAFSLSSSH